MKDNARWTYLRLTVTAAFASTLLFLLCCELTRDPRTPVLAHLAENAHADENEHQALDSGHSELGRTGVDVRPSSLGFYDIGLGRRLLFDYELTTETILRGQEAGSQPPMTLHLSGKMKILIRQKTEEGLIVEYSFPETTIRPGFTVEEVSPPETEALGRHLGLPTFVRMGYDGDTQGYRFHEEMRDDMRNWVRTLVSSFRFVVPSATGDSWTSNEADSTGVFRAQYVWADGGVDFSGPRELHKKKLHYVSLAETGDLLGYPFLEGSGVAILDRNLRWFTRASHVESVTIDAPDFGLQMGMRCKATAELVEVNTVDAAALEVIVVDSWSPVTGQHEGSSFADDREEDRVAEILAETSAEEFLQEILQLIDADELSSYALYQAGEKLALLLRYDPDLVGSIREIVVDVELNPNAATFLLAMVADADTMTGRQLLNELVGNGELSTALRASAIQSVALLRTQDVSLVDTLFRAVTDPDVDHHLRSLGVLALGALGSREAAEDGGANHALAVLLEIEGLARAQEDVSTWLSALGNTGSPRVLDAVSDYLTSKYPDERAGALESIRSAPGTEVLEAMADAARNDASAMVRATATELLAGRSEQGAFDALERVWKRESDGRVRYAAVLGIAGRLHDDPRARSLLEDAATNDPDPEIRALATESLLSSHDRPGELVPGM